MIGQIVAQPIIASVPNPPSPKHLSSVVFHGGAFVVKGLPWCPGVENLSFMNLLFSTYFKKEMLWHIKKIGTSLVK